MNVLLISMPDVAPIIMHEAAFHMPNLGIASLGANLDARHTVHLIDLVRKRRGLRRYLTRMLLQLRPDLVGLSAMTWQFDTCLKLIRLIKTVLPEVRIVIGGYHATLMYEEIGADPAAQAIDFMIRGEGEAALRGLVNALEDGTGLADIPSLSYRRGDRWVHNPKGALLDLGRLKLPIRDQRRLTRGYHIMNHGAEVIETSRGCTRNCNFCSIRHMYGRAFRPFPIERVLADIDDIYHHRHCRYVFVSDDNFVLAPERVKALCKAIVARRYHSLHFTVQADSVTIARNEEMVRLMARAGFSSLFLGVENVSSKNLQAASKGDIVDASRRAIALCRKYNMMVVAGMIFGFPDDTEAEIVANFRFLKETQVDTAYCQILTPYPKTGIRQALLAQGLVTNPDHFSTYNGMWANVRTRHLSAERLQYLVWYHKQRILGWWDPSPSVRAQGRLWTGIWIYLMRPLMQKMVAHKLRRIGWQGRYRQEIARLGGINRFPDLHD
ncbi:B12-binding domain-containing radical SAM protein [Desulfatitalea alkaliphila]|uniref:B12-binding domain-containing radical SAM protein n=1 Tax=Desulfatitalea alkaliphila TaxID=2929485 RepID=A0AA41R655_9BACT|nr:radical SAM protein [Desulfatitalea alkaliphila]MCJ8501611.1 B12-binding domain-containing radical SAM protein [Desulfatitalea alkaliphila]